jgi:signal transduction histidine kinase
LNGHPGVTDATPDRLLAGVAHDVDGCTLDLNVAAEPLELELALPLVRNACRAVEDGGVVTIACCGSPQRDHLRDVELRVSDTARGTSPEGSGTTIRLRLRDVLADD